MDWFSYVGRGAMLLHDPTPPDRKKREELVKRIDAWFLSPPDLDEESRQYEVKFAYLKRQLEEKKQALLTHPEED